ncbi:hypothetical protein P7C70_g1941, partial [Phenoliferia sp. Uapishka_3]
MPQVAAGSISLLPYELLLQIFATASTSLPPRTASRQLAAFCLINRQSYPPGKALLYRAPALPSRAVWQLSRTLRHDPKLAYAIVSLDIWSIVHDPLLRALLAACPRLKDLRLRILKHKDVDEDWNQVLDLLEAQGLERLRWIGGNAKALARCFSWGLKELAIHEYDFYSTQLPALMSSSGVVAAPTLETLSLSQTSFPFNFFDKLHPFLTHLTSLSLHSTLFYSSDIDRSISVLGGTLLSLSLLGSPSGGRALLTRAFAPLTSLVSLECSGELVEPSVFTSLAPSVVRLVIVPGDFDPEKLVIQLLRRRVGLELGSQGLEEISFRFLDAKGRRDAAARERWEKAKDRLVSAATGLETVKTMAMTYLD